MTKTISYDAVNVSQFYADRLLNTLVVARDIYTRRIHILLLKYSDFEARESFLHVFMEFIFSFFFSFLFFLFFAFLFGAVLCRREAHNGDRELRSEFGIQQKLKD